MNCPACGGEDVVVVETIGFNEIWQAYVEVLNIVFSEAVRATHTPAEHTNLLECKMCLVQFFDPARPGTPDFYEELSRAPSVPYHTQRWEFTKVANELSTGQSVVDFGAGPGWFLELARAQGCEVFAAEHNPEAIDSLLEKGIPTAAGILQLDLPRKGVDVVTAFHLLEHIPDPSLVLQQVRQVLRPGGSLWVSVPNTARSNKEEFEPLDMPPHHMTRWSAEALAAVGRTQDFTLDLIDFEPPERWGARQAMRAATYRRVAKLLPHDPSLLAGRIAGRLVSRTPGYRLLTRTSGYKRLGLLGHSMLAHYRGP